MPIVNVTGVALAPSLSVAVTVTVAEPNALLASENVRLPEDEIAGCVANNALLLFVTENVTVPVSPGPAEMFVAHGALYAVESSATVTSPPEVNAGASLTAVIVIVNVTF